MQEIDTHKCRIELTISAACRPLSASNSYRFCPPSRHTCILNPPARPVSLQDATREIWNEVVFMLSKKVRCSDGMIWGQDIATSYRGGMIECTHVDVIAIYGQHPLVPSNSDLP